MPTELTAQTITRDGLNPVYSSADITGNTFANTGQEFFRIVNDDISAKQVTVVTTLTSDGLDLEDKVVSVPAGEERIFGPYPPNTYSDTNKKVTINYDDVTSLTIALLTL